MKTHAQKVIELTISKLLQFYHEREEPLHGAIWGTWMSGKTKAAVKISRKDKKVKLMRVPEGNLSRTQFAKILSLSLGIGPGRGFLETIDCIKSTIEHKNETYVLIIDEAQRVFPNKEFLSILKDLSEELDLIYIFLGDEKLTGYLQPTYHSLVKRIIIKKELSPIEEETVSFLLRKHGYSEEAAKELTPFLKERGITTGEFDVALYLARKKRVEKLSYDELQVFLEAAVEGIR